MGFRRKERERETERERAEGSRPKAKNPKPQLENPELNPASVSFNAQAAGRPSEDTDARVQGLGFRGNSKP